MTRLDSTRSSTQRYGPDSTAKPRSIIIAVSGGNITAPERRSPETHSGTYAADFLCTSNRGGTISVDVNGKDAPGPLQITTANDPADPPFWRQWHHWNLAPQLFKIRLSEGKMLSPYTY
jgi:hypothetical protein